jgi:hypothetical protein
MYVPYSIPILYKRTTTRNYTHIPYVSMVVALLNLFSVYSSNMHGKEEGCDRVSDLHLYSKMYLL